MENKKEKLVLEGNAFYEIDLECIKKRGCMKNKENPKTPGKVQNSGHTSKGAEE